MQFVFACALQSKSLSISPCRELRFRAESWEGDLNEIYVCCSAEGYLRYPCPHYTFRGPTKGSWTAEGGGRQLAYAGC